jgi:hypothetical protein
MTSPAPETLPAVREPSRLDNLARLGQWLALSETGDTAEKAKGAAAALRLYYASELGLSPLAAAELTLIKGRLYVGAQLLRALAVRAGYRVYRADASDETCTARIVDRSGMVLGESTFTLEQAKTAGLVRQGSPWVTHPGRMLWARASKNAIVDFAPEVALGLALDDEIQEVNPGSTAVEIVDDEIEFPWEEPEPVETNAELEALNAAGELADE